MFGATILFSQGGHTQSIIQYQTFFDSQWVRAPVLTFECSSTMVNEFMIPRYPVVLFDIDHTLMDFDQTEETSLLASLTELRVDPIPDGIVQIYREISRQLWREYELNTLSKDKLRIERFVRLCERLHLPVDPNVLSENYLEFVAKSAVLIEGAEDLLKSLHPHCKIGVVTNGFSLPQHSRISLSPLHPYISSVIVSEDCGFPKPDPRIFDLAISRFPGFRKSDVLMIGDRIETDIIGAKNANIDSCWFNPAKALMPTYVKPNHIVTHLAEIKDICLNGQSLA